MIQRFELFCTSAFSIYRSIQKIERIEMEKFGLKGPHAHCLLTMSRFPEGITAAQMCGCCDKDKAAISRTVSELEEAGMLTRTCNDGKRYRSLLTLTDAGREAAARVAERAKRAVEQAGSGLTNEERAVFYNALTLIAGNLQHICDDGLEDNDVINEVSI